MLRVKITAVYFVFVALFLGLALLIVHVAVGDAIRDDAEQALRRSANAAESMTELRDGALMAKATYRAGGDRLYRSLKGEFVNQAVEEGEGETEGGEAKPAGDFAGQRHLDAHEKLTAQKYKLEELAKAQGAAAGLVAAAPLEPDMVMVLDNEAIGVAALGKDLYSWFGSDVGEQFPDVRKVASGAPARLDYWMWSFKPAEEKRLYRVAIAPVRRTEAEEPAGVIVVGNMVNDGLAAKARLAAAGSTLTEAGAKALGSDSYLDSAPEIAIFKGETVVASTLDATVQQAATSALSGAGVLSDDVDQDAVHEITLSDTTYLATTRRLQGDGVGVVALTRVSDWLAPLRSLRVNLAIVGVLILLAGLMVLFFILVRYMKPIEELETGMQEVIAGNKDYHFEALDGHDLQTGLANNLNLMSAYLQGKPMPDDEQTGGGWGDMMPGANQTANQKPGKVQGVDLSALSAPPPKKDGEG